MRQRRPSVRFIAAALAALLGTASVAARAEPDISGVWLAFGSDSRGRTSAAAPTYSDAGQAQLDAFYARYDDVPDPGAWCVPNGMPGVMLSIAGYPVEILQNEDQVTLIAELEMQVRRVYLDGRGHPEDFPPTGVGHSIGKWKGDALVVDTQLLTEWPTRPWPRSPQTHVVERLRLENAADVDFDQSPFIIEEPIDDQVLVVELTLTDPTLYDGPQRRTMYYRRVPDTSTLEYACAIGQWREELEKHRVDD